MNTLRQKIETLKKQNPWFEEAMNSLQNFEEIGGTESLEQYVQIMTVLEKYCATCRENAQATLDEDNKKVEGL